MTDFLKNNNRILRVIFRFFLVALIFPATGLSSATAAEKTDSVIVFFHQSSPRFLPLFRNNGASLDSLISRILPEGMDSIIIRSVRFAGSASPEGSVAVNQWLSKARANAVTEYLAGKVNIPDSLVNVSFAGRDWEGLLKDVEQDSEMPYREETAALISSIIHDKEETGRDTEESLLAVKTLRGGKPYRYMYSRFFPMLRATRMSVTYDMIPSFVLPGEEPLSPRYYLPAVEIMEWTGVSQQRTVEKTPFYMDLRTNMLYDVLAVPNIGIDFYLGKNFSVGANWMYGWWDKDRTHRYWRIYGGDINARWWFGKAAEAKPLTGHHLGLNAGIATYDFEFGGKGYMGGLPGRTLWDRCVYTAGIEYGYSLPVAKRLNIDFTIGLGYAGGKYIKYIPKGNGYLWQSTNRLNWIGPTKAEISLVWQIGRGNVNEKKGGNL